MKDNKVLLMVIVALLVLSIVATGVLVFSNNSNGTTGSNSGNVNTLSVAGKGEVTTLPDVGYISLGIETKNADVKIAENENSAIMDKILKALKGFDVEDTDIKTVGYNIYPQYEEYNDEKPSTYAVYNTIQITVKNLEDMSKIIDASVEAGANRTNNISFDVLDREASYNEALQDAVANARERAEILAEAAGLKIVGVVTINESSSPSYYYGDSLSYARTMDAKESLDVSISSGDIEISASVSVTFEVVNK